MADAFWVAPFALAAQSSYPTSRFSTPLYADLLAVLEPDASWTKRLTLHSDARAVALNRTRLPGTEIALGLDGAFAGLPDEVSACVLDLRPAIARPGVEPVFPRAFDAVSEWLRLRQPDSTSDPHIIVIVPRLVSTDAFPFLGFDDLIADGKVSIVDTDGALWSTKFACPAGSIQQLFKPEVGPTQALAAKMIRRLGYFQQLNDQGDRAGYTRYFFDGRYCSDELRQLLSAHFVEVFEESGEVPTVIHDDAATSWLRAPMLGAQDDFRDVAGRPLPMFERSYLENAGGADQDAAAAAAEGSATKRIIAVVPVVHRGRALHRLVRTAVAWAPAADISGLTVVVTGEGKRAKRQRSRRIDGRDYNVAALLTLPQVAVRADALAPDVSYYRSSLAGEERFVSFTSGDFWELVLEAGFITERDPPPHRSSLKVVPDLLEFSRRNGAWLASKIELAIERHTGLPVVDVSLALIAEEEAGTEFGDVLTHTLGNAPLRVPRQALTEWEAHTGSGRDLLDKWRDEGDAWILDADAASIKNVVIIDEFSYSGESLGTFASLLDALGFSVDLVLAVAAFSRRAFERHLSHYDCYALYATEWEISSIQSVLQSVRS
jgi:hypothetical protein